MGTQRVWVWSQAAALPHHHLRLGSPAKILGRLLSRRPVAATCPLQDAPTSGPGLLPPDLCPPTCGSTPFAKGLLMFNEHSDPPQNARGGEAMVGLLRHSASPGTAGTPACLELFSLSSSAPNPRQAPAQTCTHPCHAGYLRAVPTPGREPVPGVSPTHQPRRFPEEPRDPSCAARLDSRPPGERPRLCRRVSLPPFCRVPEENPDAREKTTPPPCPHCRGHRGLPPARLTPLTPTLAADLHSDPQGNLLHWAVKFGVFLAMINNS